PLAESTLDDCLMGIADFEATFKGLMHLNAADIAFATTQLQQRIRAFRQEVHPTYEALKPAWDAMAQHYATHGDTRAPDDLVFKVFEQVREEHPDVLATSRIACEEERLDTIRVLGKVVRASLEPYGEHLILNLAFELTDLKERYC